MPRMQDSVGYMDRGQMPKPTPIAPENPMIPSAPNPAGVQSTVESNPLISTQSVPKSSEPDKIPDLTDTWNKALTHIAEKPNDALAYYNLGANLTRPLGVGESRLSRLGDSLAGFRKDRDSLITNAEDRQMKKETFELDKRAKTAQITNAEQEAADAPARLKLDTDYKKAQIDKLRVDIKNARENGGTKDILSNMPAEVRVRAMSQMQRDRIAGGGKLAKGELEYYADAFDFQAQRERDAKTAASLLNIAKDLRVAAEGADFGGKKTSQEKTNAAITGARELIEGVSGGTPAPAAPAKDPVVSQLEAKGYSNIQLTPGTRKGMATNAQGKRVPISY